MHLKSEEIEWRKPGEAPVEYESSHVIDLWGILGLAQSNSSGDKGGTLNTPIGLDSRAKEPLYVMAERLYKADLSQPRGQAGLTAISLVCWLILFGIICVLDCIASRWARHNNQRSTQGLIRTVRECQEAKRLQSSITQIQNRVWLGNAKTDTLESESCKSSGFECRSGQHQTLEVPGEQEIQQSQQYSQAKIIKSELARRMLLMRCLFAIYCCLSAGYVLVASWPRLQKSRVWSHTRISVLILPTHLAFHLFDALVCLIWASYLVIRSYMASNKIALQSNYVLSQLVQPQSQRSVPPTWQTSSLSIKNWIFCNSGLIQAILQTLTIAPHAFLRLGHFYHFLLSAFTQASLALVSLDYCLKCDGEYNISRLRSGICQLICVACQHAQHLVVAADYVAVACVYLDVRGWKKALPSTWSLLWALSAMARARLVDKRTCYDQLAGTTLVVSKRKLL